jgi:hypothetical protein
MGDCVGYVDFPYQLTGWQAGMLASCKAGRRYTFPAALNPLNGQRQGAGFYFGLRISDCGIGGLNGLKNSRDSTDSRDEGEHAGRLAGRQASRGQLAAGGLRSGGAEGYPFRWIVPPAGGTRTRR